MEGKITDGPHALAFAPVSWLSTLKKGAAEHELVLSRRPGAIRVQPLRGKRTLSRRTLVSLQSSDTVNNLQSDDSPTIDKNVHSNDDENLTPNQRYMKLLRELTEAETALSNPYGTKMSHEIVQFDENGFGPRDRYVYVEERDCIGCTHCQTTAVNTFFLESDHGRARVFDQTGDSEELVEVAIDTCPVNCIYYVSWNDLVTLELVRREQNINNWARLVGGQDFSNNRKYSRHTDVMDSAIIRCDDCPGRGCAECPMYGVGNNPEYVRKKKMRQGELRKKDMELKRKRRSL